MIEYIFLELPSSHILVPSIKTFPFYYITDSHLSVDVVWVQTVGKGLPSGHRLTHLIFDLEEGVEAGGGVFGRVISSGGIIRYKVNLAGR